MNYSNNPSYSPEISDLADGTLEEIEHIER